jgi:hypothetical protein
LAFKLKRFGRAAEALWLAAERHVRLAARVDERVVSLLNASGGEVEVLSEADAKKLSLRWLDAYSKPVKQKTGSWVFNGFLWHAFSFEFSPARQGAEALCLYALERKRELIVLQEPDHVPAAAWLRELPAPDLSALGLDLYVFPESLRWTMAFTHEQPEIGPFYSRSEWLRRAA